MAYGMIFSVSAFTLVDIENRMMIAKNEIAYSTAEIVIARVFAPIFACISLLYSKRPFAWLPRERNSAARIPRANSR